MGPAGYGSDVVAELLRGLDFPYLAINPGASYRGLHDSIVNHLGNERPRLLLCLHEEHAVAIAHGYAKVAGEPLAVAVHSNVGLLHASMAIFNAFCDRVPILVLGATGPLDAARRRPWIDWIHTSTDQAALVRPFLKFDDQPLSAAAAVESILRANLLARTAPRAPVYVCLDAEMQERKLQEAVQQPDLARYRPPQPAAPEAAAIAQAKSLLARASRPVLLSGRVSRDAGAWERRVALAEALQAAVLTDLKAGAAFPTDHPLHGATPGYFLGAGAIEVLRNADLVLSLDWIDLAGAAAHLPRSSKVIHCSVDHRLHRGFALDHQGLAPVDLWLDCEPDAAVAKLLEELRLSLAPRRPRPERSPPHVPITEKALDMSAIAAALRTAAGGHEVSILRVPLGWPGDAWTLRGPLDYLGYDGGAGIGSGPGMAVGAALALRGSGRLPVAVLGDGDLLMGCSALWTAAQERIPLLIVVANNRSYFNDEMHQERVARHRGRPVERRWIGLRLDNPAPDLAGLARSLGLRAEGPISEMGALQKALLRAVQGVLAGESWLVDVLV